ncbi:hypothetical protein R75471_01670 [Paraburkholderia domus]|uniref:hypothetical protein n=1 Tax=Paraburkholderia domus TaxID=2793075 RepID=UPI001B23E79E|nr:hypothetical protein [Paraburkholderia domus]CAE6878960.1 hypothetical protein R75471_01670 [Paraburkholderia domus]
MPTKRTVGLGSDGDRELIDEITLDQRRVAVRCIELPLAEVKLDPTNPRVANTVAVSSFGRGESLQRQLSDLLWEDPDVRALYQSVLANKGLVERIIVRHDGVVAEGNCRTVVYNRLAANHPNDPSWKRIPARVLPDDITDRQVAVLLGELHVGGKNKWSAFEKAGHIHKLSNNFGLTQDEIAKLLKTSKTAVNHSTRAFAAMKEKYLPQFPGTTAVRKFSYFLELYKQPQLRDWVGSDEHALDDFVQWVGLNKISKGADVRELTEIIKNTTALEAFRVQGADAARKVLELAQPELTSALFKLMLKMTEALDGARLDDIQRVRKDKVGSSKKIVRNLKDSLDRFVDLCDGI